MNMKRVHANHIIAELTRRLADRDEELDKHLCRIHKLEEDAEDDCSCIETQRVEITRLKALCQEPVMLSDAEPYECHLARAIKERT